MKAPIQHLATLFAAIALTGCGGGGDDPAPAPAPPAGTKFTQAEVLTVAKLGAATAVLTELRVMSMLSFQGGFLQGFSTGTGGSGTSSFNCTNGGSASAVTTRSAARTGLAVGDSVVVTYSNCTLGTVVVSGVAALTAVNDMSNLAADNFDARFRATLTNFSLNLNSVAVVHNGTISVISQLSNGNIATNAFTVPSGASYSHAASGVDVRFARQATAAYSESASNNAGSFVLDGGASLVTAPGTVAVSFSTPTPLTGPRTSGYVVPAAGVFNTTSTAQTLATSVLFSGNVVTVSGDTDKNGSLDLVFGTTWAELSGL